MKYASNRFSPSHSSFLLLASLALLALSIGCAGGSGSSSTPPLSGNTQVVVQLAGTGNDRLTSYSTQIQSLTLTDSEGKVVTLLNGGAQSASSEFMHVNGVTEPAASVSVPQATYESAALTLGGSLFGCNTLTPQGGIDSSYFGYGVTQQSVVTLPYPITIRGSVMALNLDLQVSQSYTMGSCYWDQGSTDPFSILPTFNLTPMVPVSQPANPANGKSSSVDGLITSVNAAADSFTMTPADGATLTVQSSGATVYQGVSGLSALAVGVAVDADLAIQSDGSLLATRVAVADPDPTSLGVSRGPLVFVSNADPVFDVAGRQALGNQYLGNTMSFSFGNAEFAVSGQMSNLQKLPFSAVFSPSNIVAGQEVSLTTHQLYASPWPTYYPASTVTLMPQTIDGTIFAVGSSGGFTTYTVMLASYDVFPTFANQAGQTTLLNNPGTIVIYADSNTQMLNTTSLTAGSLLRFRGLVFNDSGTLRMDCAQINDGVPE